MARARIGTAASSRTLVLALAIGSSPGCGGCALDSRQLTVHGPNAGDHASDDASVPSFSDGATPPWRMLQPDSGYGGAPEPSRGAGAGASGSGGTAAAGQGGDSGAPAAGAGAAGASGGGAGAGAGGQDAGDGDSGSPSGPLECHAITVSNAWVDAFSNCLEIHGEVIAAIADGDSFNSHLISDPLCMQAPAASSSGPTTLGFYLEQETRDAEPADYDARLHDVTGFRFRVTDYLAGAPFPFVGVESQGEIYCMPIADYGGFELRFAELRARCWESTPGPAPDPEHIRSLVFYYPAGFAGESIGMCFENIVAIVENG
jgi:hypothetical protein